MHLFWFLAGILTTLATLIVALPMLRRDPRWSALPAASWPAVAGLAVAAVGLLGLYRWQASPAVATASSVPAAASASVDGTGAFGTAAKVFGSATAPAASGLSKVGMGDGLAAGGTPPKAAAGSMDSAIASLEARLAKGGGTADDWELLAKSFEFLGRPADAAKARAHQLPALAADTQAPAAAAGAAVSGEVSLAPTLAGKAASGETLFIIAKSVNSPGIPVAVFRSSVGAWPLKFRLDDSQSMMPGRTLSSAGKVTIEARISQKGQPLPTAGDLQGSSGPIDPTDHAPLKILIDHVIS
jgi:cytochrome c-type biogenesis protein CcmH